MIFKVCLRQKSDKLSLGDGLICDRCSQAVHYVEKCDYCAKSVCVMCEKSAKRIRKIRRAVICKNCWGTLSTRKKFKALN